MASAKYGSPEWIVEYAAFMVRAFENAGLQSFKNYLASAQRASKALDEAAVRQYMADESALTDHAALMRSISAHLTLLERGHVPALLIDDGSQLIRSWAAQSVGWVDANLKALRHRLEQSEALVA